MFVIEVKKDTYHPINSLINFMSFLRNQKQIKFLEEFLTQPNK
jgi:hypothetical protein